MADPGKSEAEKATETDIQAMVDAAPEDKRAMILESLSIMAMSMESSPESSVSKKMTSEHITQFMKDSGDNMRLTHKADSRKQWMIFGSVFLLLVFFVFVIIEFKANPDFIEKLLYSVGGLIAGALGGFGYGKSKKGD